MQNTVKEKQSFDRVVISKEQALEMFAENKFKVGCMQQHGLSCENLSRQVGLQMPILL